MSMRDQIEELERALARLGEQIAALKGESLKRSAEQLFPGTWRKSWRRADGSGGSENFVVEGTKLRLTKTDVGIKAKFDLELVSDDGDTIVLRQSHPSGLACYPTCDITIRRIQDGYAGTEVANGETIQVTYDRGEVVEPERVVHDYRDVIAERRKARAAAEPKG